MFMQKPSKEHMDELPCSSLAAALAESYSCRTWKGTAWPLSPLMESRLDSCDPNPKERPLIVAEVCGGNLAGASVGSVEDTTAPPP